MNDWSEWFFHDGAGCPCVGKVVHVVGWDGTHWTGIAGSECARVGIHPSDEFSAWVWDRPRGNKVIRYRLRKPRGLTILENLIADLPAPVQPKVNA